MLEQISSQRGYYSSTPPAEYKIALEEEFDIVIDEHIISDVLVGMYYDMAYEYEEYSGVVNLETAYDRY